MQDDEQNLYASQLHLLAINIYYVGMVFIVIHLRLHLIIHISRLVIHKCFLLSCLFQTFLSLNLLFAFSFIFLMLLLIFCFARNPFLSVSIDFIEIITHFLIVEFQFRIQELVTIF